MAEGRIRYRLRQNGTVVAWADGPTAMAEIQHYALVYGQDAPVCIEHYERHKWRSLSPPVPNKGGR